MVRASLALTLEFKGKLQQVVRSKTSPTYLQLSNIVIQLIVNIFFKCSWIYVQIKPEDDHQQANCYSQKTAPGDTMAGSSR